MTRKNKIRDISEGINYNTEYKVINNNNATKKQYK